MSVLDRDAGVATTLNEIRDGKATAKDAMSAQPKIQQVLDAYWATQPAGR